MATKAGFRRARLTMKNTDLFLVFDVESVGLHGQGFAVGYVVKRADGEHLADGCFACPLRSEKSGMPWPVRWSAWLGTASAGRTISLGNSGLRRAAHKLAVPVHRSGRQPGGATWRRPLEHLALEYLLASGIDVVRVADLGSAVRVSLDHALERGANVRDIQQALGHKFLDTTMGYVRPAAERVTSPLDAIAAQLATA